METASQMASIYVANEQALRHQAMVDAVYTPAVQDAIANYKKSILQHYKVGEEWQKQIAEIFGSLPKIEIPDSLVEQVSKQFQIQNKELVKVMRSAALGSAINFKLPDGYLGAIAGWREHLEAEAAEADDPGVASEWLLRIAEEREAIIKFLYRTGMGLEGLSCIPESPLPHFVGFFFLLAAMLGEVADEKLSRREDSAD